MNINIQSLVLGWKDRLFPFLSWRGEVSKDVLRPDLEAGFIGAILILPQAIALATLAGMPPEYGIYTSIIPVIIASLWGSSWHALSGPNTAVCVLIAYSVSPFASIGTEAYIGFVLALTLMAGLIQFLVGILKLGGILDFISETVISAIVLAVGFIIIVSAASSFLGVLSNSSEPFFIRLYQIIHDIPRANGYAVTVGIITVATGLVLKRYWKRYALVIAVLVGTLASVVINGIFGSAVTQIELIGNLSLSLLPLSAPTFDLESAYVIKAMISSAFSIAFLGLMQSIVIARSLAAKSGQRIDTNQEIIGQGLSNMIAPFFSCFAGSGSFNRSGAHYEAGAKTPLAAIYASVMLAIIVLAGAPLIAYMPVPTVAGALILVGLGLIDFTDARRAMLSRHETFIFFLTFGASMVFGLNAGVFTGLLLSLVIYLWYASKPNVVIQEHTSRDGRSVTVLTLDGNLFFGSVRYVEKMLETLGRTEKGGHILVIRTDHLTYIDVPGALMLASEARRRKDRGDEMYLMVTRNRVIDVLINAGIYSEFGHDYIIEKGREHPMMDILFPSRGGGNAGASKDLESAAHASTDLPRDLSINRFRNHKLFSSLSEEQLEELIGRRGEQVAEKGTVIVSEFESMKEHLIVLDGDLEARRSWEDEYGKSRSYEWTISANESEGDFGVISAAFREVRVHALTDVRYIPIDADELDELMGMSQLAYGNLFLSRLPSFFRKLPMENVKAAFSRMNEENVEAGDTIVNQGDTGDSYFVIESGQAEVIRSDPLSDRSMTVAILGPGDAFGEEALLQDGYRNASVKMKTPGKLLELTKTDFTELLKPAFVDEVTPEEAQSLVNDNGAVWLDCRHDMEHQECRIPDSLHMSLDHIRDGVSYIDPDKQYVVYCRTGRRSKAATYILNERNIKAVSLQGGIRDWPYAVDFNLDIQAE